ncbi:MAG: hypothetical protein IJ158_09050 [Treponema sp.]|nr:hypothetical protein [Treponema sp.]MBR1404437.1 hypothetical protein [Treponema sp.]
MQGIEIGTDSKIFIVVPAGVVTGGVELLHQLCDTLIRYGAQAYVVYYGSSPHRIPDDYKKYRLKLAESIEDNVKNILVIPEVSFDMVSDVKNIQILVWWLSVDNYFLHFFGSVYDNFRFSPIFCLERVVREFFDTLFLHKIYKKYPLKKIALNKNIVCHAYQSEYANDFLKRNGIEDAMPLSDYVNEDYAFVPEMVRQKENIVIYNPKKGLRFSKRLIAAAPDLQWIPIQNMSREKVKETMLRAKLYIDFGHFPGKDRMPREAALCGCCIIMGKLGAAGFAQDFPIDESKYKFSQRNSDIPQIIGAIRTVLEHYETIINDFASYREKISHEKAEFEKAVKELRLV